MSDTSTDLQGRDGGNDNSRSDSGDDASSVPAVTGETPVAALSFGPALAAARQSLGVSVAEVAGRMRLHPRQVAALEAEQLTVLPEATFVRGFIRNYAKELRLDPLPLIASFDARVGPAAAVKAIGRGPSRIVQAAERERMSRQLVILGGVGLLIVLGAIGWLASQRPVTTPTPAPVSPSAASTTPSGVLSVAPSAAAGDSATPSIPPNPAAADTSAAGSTAGVVPPLAGSSAATGSVTPRAEPTDGARPAPATGAGSPLIRLTTGERASWVEVVQQVDGRVVFAGLVEANGERRLLVVPPVRATVGNAATVTLEYRGKPVDLGTYVRDDVARLTLE